MAADHSAVIKKRLKRLRLRKSQASIVKKIINDGKRSAYRRIQVGRLTTSAMSKQPADASKTTGIR